MIDFHSLNAEDEKLHAALQTVTFSVGATPCATAEEHFVTADGSPLFRVNARLSSFVVLYGRCLPVGEWTRLVFSDNQKTVQVAQCRADGSFFTVIALEKGDHLLSVVTEKGSEEIERIDLLATGKSTVQSCKGKPFTVISASPFIFLHREYGNLILTRISDRRDLGMAVAFDGDKKENSFAVAVLTENGVAVTVYDYFLNPLSQAHIDCSEGKSLAVMARENEWLLIVTVASGAVFSYSFSDDLQTVESNQETEVGDAQSVLAVKGEDSSQFVFFKKGKACLYDWTERRG